MTYKMRTILSLIIIIIFTLLFSACDLFLESTPAPPATLVDEVTPGQPDPGSVGLPDMPDKPEPVVETFKGCPPEGDGGDAIQNRLKNRVDEAEWIPVEFDAIMGLTWPRDIERRDRENWSAEDTAFIAQYEGLPVSAEGYLAGAKVSGAESTNCQSDEHRDYHVWLTRDPVGNDRTQSIVTEPTPRSRAKHPGWNTELLKQVAADQLRVRISGWLFFDPEHPEQIGQTRGTLWEIHPVMEIEVLIAGQWVTLDDLANQQ